ncbi:MAG: hypothetical protein ACQEXC_14285 [Pseudomonadota bacterium]
MSAAIQNEMERLERVNKEQWQLLDLIHQYVDEHGLAKLGQSRVRAMIEAHRQLVEEHDALAAHVESVQQTAATIRGYSLPHAGRCLAMLMDAVEEASTTSLARRYAEELMNGATPCPDGGKCHKSGLTCGYLICEEWGADLKAEWQAEALDRLRELLEETHMAKAPTVARAVMHIDDAINRVKQECKPLVLRRQAEGGE